MRKCANVRICECDSVWMAKFENRKYLIAIKRIKIKAAFNLSRNYKMNTVTLLP